MVHFRYGFFLIFSLTILLLSATSTPLYARDPDEEGDRAFQSPSPPPAEPQQQYPSPPPTPPVSPSSATPSSPSYSDIRDDEDGDENTTFSDSDPASAEDEEPNSKSATQRAGPQARPTTAIYRRRLLRSVDLRALQSLQAEQGQSAAAAVEEQQHTNIHELPKSTASEPSENGDSTLNLI